MQKELLTIDGMATSKEAAAVMRSHGASELLVHKRNDDDAWGIVSISDLIRKVVVPDRKAEDVYVYEIMTKPVITVPADMDIRYAIRLVHGTGLHRAPVESMGKIVGMITLSSLVLDHELL